jgi:bile acid-coenzyme A ligase
MGADQENGAAGPGPLPMGDLLTYHADKGPGRPAVTWGDVSVSYAELEARANRKARQFAQLGVGAGDVVTVALPKGIEYYETLFAVWKLGATPNNVSSRLPPAELQAIVELAQPRLIVGEENARIAGWTFLRAGERPDDSLSDAPLPSIVPGCFKIMTSGGSTGRPKLIKSTMPGVHDPDSPALLQQAGNTILNPGPLYHNAPFVASLSCLFTGGHVVEMDKFDPLHALELIERHRVHWINFVPTMMSRIWKLPQEQRESFDLSSLRTVWHMASICPAWLKEAWIGWLGPDKIYEMYGGTEATGVTIISGTEWLAHRGSVGKVHSGARMRIFDEQGNACPPGQIGEIYFLPDNGANSTYEYIGAQSKSIGDWQTYGDLGHMDEEGYLYIADRRTDLIVSGGANIFPAEVESALEQHPDVASAIVIGLPDADLGQRVHAIVQLSGREPGAVAIEALRAFLGERLVRYKIPRTFEFVAENLRDDAGKARRSQLRDERIAAEPAASAEPHSR